MNMRRFFDDFKVISESGRFLIAITGTIGSGKTTVLEFFKRFGCFTVSSDDIVKRILTQRNYCSIILNRYPQVGFDNAIDRSKLARLIFSNKKAKRFVEGIVHPAVILEILNEIRNTNKKLVAVEVPLLFESGISDFFDITICVVCDKEIAIKRLLKRGMKLNDIRLRMKSQMDDNIKIEKSDIVIYNNGWLSQLKKKVLMIYRSLKKIVDNKALQQIKQGNG